MNNFYLKIDNNILNKAKQIKALILDVDGVLTDGKIYLLPNDDETKSFNMQDGHGLVSLRNNNIILGIITGRKSKIVKSRIEQLKIKFYRKGITDKYNSFLEFLAEYNLKANECAYVGDDIIDLSILTKVGLSFTVNNAHDMVKKNVDYITKKNGGDAAVREICDIILFSQNKYFNY